jgi:ABC-type antimicrobial peptide transport system permease subunit
MSTNKRIPKPPRWAQRLLEWYCRPELIEDLQGDLNEYFHRNCKLKGSFRAKVIYVIDVIKFFRLYTLRRPQFFNLLTHWIMIGSYFRTSGRVIARHKLFSFINIAGLAVSMSVGLLMIVFVSDLISYDSFHEKRERIFRVISKDQNHVDVASTSVLAGKIIKENFTGIEEATLVRRDFGGDASTGERTLPVSGLWADESFLNVFTFPLLYGNAATALKDPYSIVLTEDAAERLFGTSKVLGRSLKFDTTHYLVTGILKNIPKLSHMRFETLASFSTVEIANTDPDGDFWDWSNVYTNYAYVVLPEDAAPENLKASLDKLSAQQNVNSNGKNIQLGIQRLTEISIGKSLENQLGPKLPALAIWILVGLTCVVILSAGFNYTNLSIARSLRRCREVGIRKVVGASKGHVVNQFIVESVLIAFMALVFAFLIFLFLRQQFLSLHPFIENLVSLELSLSLIFYFLVFAVFVGTGAGFLPALFYAKVNAIQVLKNASFVRVFQNISLRKSLIIVQYVFSLVFITVTILGYKQYKSFITFDLGFTTGNIVNIFLQGNKADRVVERLSALPEVQGISKSLLVMSLGSNYNITAKHNESNDSTNVWLNFVDEHYLPLHDHQFLAGKNFNARSEQSIESEIIVNEKFLREFNLDVKNPAKALGEVIAMDNKKLAIVGVVKDFHYETLEDEIKPMAFRHFVNPDYGYVNVKLSTTDWYAAMSKIENMWKTIDSVHPLNAKFYDEQIEQAYSQFIMMIKVIGFLSFLAICIASMGLFGMVVFSTETRLKEMSIRKVFGAGDLRLVFLLSKGFMLLLMLAAAIALPATYLFFENVVLVNFAYHEPIRMVDVFLGLVGVMVIACCMVASQTFKVARSNPAEVLKNE